MTSNLLSLARGLQRRKARRRRRLAVIEGVRLVEEALTAAVTLRGALVGPGFGETEREAAVLRDLADHAVPTVDVSPRELREATDTRTPQGIAAIIEIPAWTLEAIQPGGAPVLVLDAVRDPGNVGSLLRTAWALGSPGAVLLDGSADLANPKVIRAGMGATLRFAAATAGVRQFAEWSRSAGLTVWVAAAEGTPIQRLEAPPKLAVVVGNEGAGVRNELRALADRQVAITLARGVESLNVVAAAGIILHEARSAD